MTIDELGQVAASEQMVPNAPIQTARSMRIAAPLGKVWNTLTGLSNWEYWYPYLVNATLNGTFAAGTKLTYGGFIKHKLRLAKVVPENW